MSVRDSFSKKEKRKKNAVRLLCLFLAVLMVAGMAYYIILITASGASAAEVYKASQLKDDSDIKIAIGLSFGDSMVPEFQITSDTGFEIGVQDLKNDKEYTPVWELYNGVISATSDANLELVGNDYHITNVFNKTLIGAYHIQIDCDDLDREEFQAYLASVSASYAPYGLEAIPCWIYTGYAVRLGNFASWDQAYPYFTEIAAQITGRKVSLITPSYTAVSVIDPYAARILFEYDCGAQSEIGFSAKPDAEGNTYMKTPSGNPFDGVFAFKRYTDGVKDGVTLINVLPIEAYIAGVLPYEISNTWPIEVQKEFAVAARSFALTHIGTGKHSKYGFDLCNTDCCEIYKGAGRINDAVLEAVLGTKGQVICYDGGIVTSYYSSTVGGVTVSSADCWGGSEIPYLQAIETPWEDYMNHSNGFWINEVSPAELLERLHKAGYEELQGSIADMQIEELAKNSTYIKKLKVTDIYGTSVTITNTDRVRTSLTPYVNSANFVVARGSVEYTETTAVTERTDDPAVQPTDGTQQADKSEGFIETDEIHVATSDSYDKIDYLGYVNIMTAEGVVECTRKNIFTATKNTAQAYLGDEYDLISGDISSSGSSSQLHPTEIVATDGDTTTKIAYASDPNNFIFVGKGWGHGVGMSQWGAYDLAVKGYKYDEIIRAYFPTVSLVNYWTTDNYKWKKQ